MWVNNKPKATQWNSGATRDSNRGHRARTPSALTTRQLSHMTSNLSRPNNCFYRARVLWNYSLTGEQNVQVAAVNVCVLADCNVVVQWTAAAIVSVIYRRWVHGTLTDKSLRDDRGPRRRSIPEVAIYTSKQNSSRIVEMRRWASGEKRTLSSIIKCIKNRGDWKRGTGKRGTIKNAGVENAGLENVGPNRRGGKRGTGKRGTISQGWKSQDWKTEDQFCRGGKRGTTVYGTRNVYLCIKYKSTEHRKIHI